jgi:Flp pilus assembly pilin Flp
MANYGRENWHPGGHGMSNFFTKLYVKVSEAKRGQTMTEYALILSAVAVVVFVGYQAMGTNIQKLLNSVDSQL